MRVEFSQRTLLTPQILGTTHTSVSLSGIPAATLDTSMQEQDTAGTMSFGSTFNSPTLSSMKRARTTMEKVVKKPKTYGNKTTLDDLGLGRSVYAGSWAKAIDECGGEIADGPERKKKKQHHRQEDESLKEVDVFAKFANKTTTSSSRNMTIDPNATIFTGIANGLGEEHTAADPLEPIDSPNDAISLITDPTSQNENAMPPEEAGTEDIDTSAAGVIESKDGDTSTRRASKIKEEKHAKGDSIDDMQSRKQPRLSDKHNKRKKRKHGESSERETCDPWAHDSDLPQEHYKPRRSRFRGAEDEVDELMETIDFSKRPEAVAKKKTKLNRRKTTGGAIVVHVDDKEDSPFGEIEERAFEPSKSRSSKTPIPTIELDGDNDEDGFTKPAPPQKEKKKRGRPKKSDATEGTSETGISAHEEGRPPEDRSTRSEPNGKKSKKKERDATPPVTSTEGNDIEDRESIFIQDERDPPHGKPAPNVEVRIEQQPTTPSPKKSTAAPLADKTNLSSASIQVELPGKVQDAKTSKEEDKSPKKHSPLSSSVVRYRVGLSRRARIEPLLRIRKK